eukprot:GFUD01031343.1.p1 GENE.GFUD01031343.1~~GFUD01031343.1.p1  ORF type:complete len:321 (+),score=64.65 GFUD01031343.1:266-1228(+)
MINREVNNSKNASQTEYPLGHFWILFDVYQSTVDTHGLSLIGEKRSALRWDGKLIDSKLMEEGKEKGIIFQLGTVFRMTKNIVEHINDKCLNKELFNPKDTGIEGPEVDIKQIHLPEGVEPANIPAEVAKILLPVVKDVFKRNIHPGQVAILLDKKDIEIVFGQEGLEDVIRNLNTSLNKLIRSKKENKKLAPEVTASITESILSLEPHKSVLNCKCKMFMGSVDEMKGFTLKMVVYIPFFRTDLTPVFVGNRFVSRTSPCYKAISRSSCEAQIKEIVLDDDSLSMLGIASKTYPNANQLQTLGPLHENGKLQKSIIKRR